MKQDSNKRLLAGVAFVGAAIFTGTFASNTIAQVPDTTALELADRQLVKITFDAQGCPLAANPDTFDITKSKKIAWQAIDASGNPVAQSYTIYFDPFAGRPLNSKTDGQLKSPPFDKSAPATAAGIEYKYSIVGVNCPNAPLDPRFLLR